MDHNYPTIDFEFIDFEIRKSDKFLDFKAFGNAIVYFQKGSSPLFKRTSAIYKSEDMQVSYMNATGLAIKYNFMPQLIVWLASNRDFKDGGFTC